MSHNNQKIIIKNEPQIAWIREAWKHLTEILHRTRDTAKAWITLLEIEDVAAQYLKANQLKWTFVWHHGYKHNLCLSVNDCVVHGIPDRYILKDWDLLKIDVGVTYKWHIADAAVCVIVWWDHTNPDAKKLVETTKWALDTGLQFVKPGRALYDFWYAVEQYVKKEGCTIIKQLTGHGVGTALWEPPYIYNWAHPSQHDIHFKPGMVVALEPITAMWSTWYIEKPKINDWNLYTQQWDLWAQWEYTVLITENWHEVLAGIQ